MSCYSGLLSWLSFIIIIIVGDHHHISTLFGLDSLTYPSIHPFLPPSSRPTLPPPSIHQSTLPPPSPHMCKEGIIVYIPHTHCTQFNHIHRAVLTLFLCGLRYSEMHHQLLLSRNVDTFGIAGIFPLFKFMTDASTYLVT